MAYAAGTLPEAYSLVVACHISICDQCRCAIEGYDAMGGALFDQLEEAPLSPDSLAATMALIEQDQPNKITTTTPKPSSIFPEPLRKYVGGDENSVKWRRIGGGVKQAILPCDGEATARLLYIPAGMAVPDHGHNGLELTLVLQGAFSDEVDQFARGDVETGDENLSHTPIADAGPDCICLAATDAPLKFNTFLPKVLQPFIGI